MKVLLICHHALKHKWDEALAGMRGADTDTAHKNSAQVGADAATDADTCAEDKMLEAELKEICFPPF